MTASSTTKPTALIVGPMKCGTSWIHDYFAGRGDICLPSGIKETFYYDRYHHRGLGWYTKHFEHFEAGRHAAIVEVAPSLFHASREVAALVATELGDIPIIITLRDPVKRAWSHYQHMSRGYTNLPLRDAVEKFPEIVNASRYSVHIPAWKKSFSKVTLLLQSELATNPQSYARLLAHGLSLSFRDPGELARKRSNEATAPRSFLLARVGRYGARAFRYVGLYSIVNALKNAGLKSLFYSGGQAGDLMPSDADIAFLESLLADERQFVSMLMSESNLS